MDYFRSLFGMETEEMRRIGRELKAKHENKKREEARRREQEEEKEKQRILKEIAEKEKREQEERDKEVKEETERTLRTIKENVTSYNEAKEAAEQRLRDLNSQIEKNIEKAIEEKKREGIQKVTDEKDEVKRDKEQLVEQKKQLTEAVEDLSSTRQRMVLERAKLKEELENKEKADIEKHQEKLAKMQEKSFESAKEGEKRLNEMAEEHKDYQTKTIEKREQLEGLQMQNAYQLLDAHGKDQTFEDFRREARRLINLFNRFRRNFKQEESELISTRDLINKGLPVMRTPDLMLAINSLNELNEALQEFECDGATDKETYEELRDTVHSLVEQLSTIQGNISSNIENYQEAFDVHAERVARASPTISELDYVVPGTASTAPPTLRPDSPNISASEQFNIADLFEENQKLMREISILMLRFNVRETTLFHDTLTRQVQELSIGIGNTLRITQGASSSNQAALEESKTPDEKESTD